MDPCRWNPLFSRVNYIFKIKSYFSKHIYQTISKYCLTWTLNAGILMSFEYFPCLYSFLFFFFLISEFRNSTRIRIHLFSAWKAWSIFKIYSFLSFFKSRYIIYYFFKKTVLSYLCSLHNFYYIEESWRYEAFLHLYSISKSLHKHFQSLTEVFADRWLYSYVIIYTHTKGEI